MLGMVDWLVVGDGFARGEDGIGMKAVVMAGWEAAS